MQCGIACLGMVCRIYGRKVSLKKLEGLSHTSAEGISLLGIKEGADRLGFKTSAGKFTIHQLVKIKLPAIIHWNQNHFVVLCKITKNSKFHVADPGKGVISYSKKEFADHWICSEHGGEPCGIVMELMPTESFYKHVAEEAPEKRSFRFLYRYIKQ